MYMCGCVCVCVCVKISMYVYVYIWDVYIRRRLHLYDSGTPINIFISVQPPSMHKQCGKVWKSMHKQCGKIDEGDLSISIWMEHPNMAGEDIHTCLIFKNIKYPQNWCVCVYKYKIRQNTTTTTHFNNFPSLTFRIACTSRLMYVPRGPCLFWYLCIFVKQWTLSGLWGLSSRQFTKIKPFSLDPINF